MKTVIDRRTRLRSWLVKALLAGLLLLLIVSLRRAWTPPIPGGIASLEQIDLRGSKQWILVRGKHAGAPVVLFLHGGPAIPLMPLAYRFQRPLEDHFVVVQWDQRGAGKSFYGSSATIGQLVDDTIALSEMLKQRFGKKIYLVGCSWGTYLGVVAAEKRPDLFAGYIGVGQLVVYDPLNQKRGESLHGRGTTGLALSAFLGTEYTWRDYWRYALGYGAGLETRRELLGKTIRNLRPKVPMYLFEGRFDGVAPPALVEAYAKESGATLVWFEHSAHWVFIEEPDKFLAELRAIVK